MREMKSSSPNYFKVKWSIVKNEVIEWKYYEFTSWVHSEMALSISETPDTHAPKPSQKRIFACTLRVRTKILLVRWPTVLQIRTDLNETWLLVYSEDKKKKKTKIWERL